MNLTVTEYLAANRRRLTFKWQTVAGIALAAFIVGVIAGAALMLAAITHPPQSAMTANAEPRVTTHTEETFRF